MLDFNENEFMEAFRSLLAIDSTTGLYERIQDFLKQYALALGFRTIESRKGGLIVDLGGGSASDDRDAVVLTAHVDDIGICVRKINPDGTLKCVKVGGLYPNNCVGENVRVYTRDGNVYTGTICRTPNSIHVTDGEIRRTSGDFETNTVVVLDKDVRSAADTRALGIETGDLIALEPRLTVSEGYIKSRFIDNKACAALLMNFMKSIKEKGIGLSRRVYFYFTVYEENGCGASCIPEDAGDIIALDIAPTGPDQNSEEHKVTLFAKDSSVVYHWGLTNEIRAAAIRAGVDYTVDVFTPNYGSDASASVHNAGRDLRHAGFGPGTANSHGYERTHIKALENTYRLLCAYLLG